jgi:hypothetical protein
MRRHTTLVGALVTAWLAAPAAAQVASRNEAAADSGPVQSVEPPLAGQPVPADFGSAVKGTAPPAGWGKASSRNNPSGHCGPCGSFGSFTFGPGGVTNYNWQIDDPGPSSTFPNAPGHAGGTSSVFGQPDYGWNLIPVIRVGPQPGNFFWTATTASPLTVILQTLTGQTTVGNDVLGPMQNFDNTQNYSWQFVTWAGNYTGPTDTATLNSETIFDMYSGPFANSLSSTAKFGWQLKFNSGSSGPGELDLTYSPVPEPGTLGLVAAGLLAVWRAGLRRRPVAGGDR